MAASVTNVLICGTGGQGILTASEVLSSAAQHAGFDVKKSEVHGMAQRGGSVTSHVRFGKKVYSPLIELGTADVVLAMEKLEAARWMHFLAPEGRLLVCDLEINPLTVNIGQAEYPDVDSILEDSGAPCTMVPAFDVAERLGNMKVVNTVMLGALSGMIGLPEDSWKAALAERIPQRALEVNTSAFGEGRDLTG
jgi:indolepyruvate ferredoxin oxidoreductase beta subunit